MTIQYDGIYGSEEEARLAAEDSAAVKADYDRRHGHLEGLAMNMTVAGLLLQILTCILGGLLMAINFYPVISLVAAVLICKAINTTIAANTTD